jgi:hypothetical protein
MNGRWLRTILGLGVVLLIGWLGWRYWDGRRPLAEMTLADGRSVRILAGQVGDNHYDPFMPLHERVLELCPAAIRKILPWKVTGRGVSQSSNSLSLWVVFNGKSAGAFNKEFKLLIGDGVSYSSTQWYYPPHTNSLGEDYELYMFTTWPRHEETWEVRLYTPESVYPRKLLGTAKVRNPFRVSNASLAQAPAYPVRVVEGDLELLLKGIIVGKPSKYHSMHEELDPEDFRTRLEFDIRKDGERTTNWVSYHVVSMTDADGNRSDGNSWNHGWEDDVSFIEFAEWPLPVRGAWDLKVEFTRVGGFSEEHVWEFKNLPTPDARREEELASHSVERIGRRLDIIRVDRSGLGNAEVVIKITPPLKGERIVFLDGTSDDGASVTSGGWSGSLDRVTFHLNVEEGAKELNVRLAIHPSVFAEFTAQPTAWKKPASVGE